MTRRCVEGDWAITSRTNTVVRCIKFLGKVPGWAGDDRWETDKPRACLRVGTSEGSAQKGDVTYSVRDASLTPLRGTFEEIIAQATAIRLGAK